VRFHFLAWIGWLALFDARVNAESTYSDICPNEECRIEQAGYEWAAVNGIASEFECDGRALDFIDGCRAYIEDSRSPPEENKTDEEE
jgi:hypothetical protein